MLSANWEGTLSNHTCCDTKPPFFPFSFVCFCDLSHLVTAYDKLGVPKACCNQDFEGENMNKFVESIVLNIVAFNRPIALYLSA
jgi:hypothetical protein